MTLTTCIESPSGQIVFRFGPLLRSTESGREFKTADEMYAHSPDLGEYVLIFHFLSWDETMSLSRTWDIYLSLDDELL